MCLALGTMESQDWTVTPMLAALPAMERQTHADYPGRGRHLVVEA